MKIRMGKRGILIWLTLIIIFWLTMWNIVTAETTVTHHMYGGVDYWLNGNE